MGSYEVLEHTADVGLRAVASDLAELFETAAEGMAAIAGVHRPGRGEPVAIALESSDLEGLLVDWLNEVLYQHDSRGAALRTARVWEVDDTSVRATIELAPLDERDDEGIQIKAVTYHQLAVRKTEDGWEAMVFFDV